MKSKFSLMQTTEPSDAQLRLIMQEVAKEARAKNEKSDRELKAHIREEIRKYYKQQKGKK